MLRDVKANRADVYYCAVELNGSDMHFDGDVSLVIKHEHTAADTSASDRAVWRHAHSLLATPAVFDRAVHRA